ncbi:MAG: LacI family DNA-binding transcriptional regulator [Chloroflexota bacterium]|nr:LacI family DNA-binding transcriptional regulator [Chloroflexota bacterium]
MSSRVTMADVAKESGVSLMTVSRVVNNKGDVSEETRRRVMEVIERLDFRPSGIARGLATRRTGTVGLVVPDVSNPFFSTVARGVEREADANDYSVFLCNSDEDPQQEIAHLKSLEENRVDGVIICSSRLHAEDLTSLLHRYAAAVLVNRRLDQHRVSTVICDDGAGGQLATQFLLESGHRAIGFVAGPRASYSGRSRVQGYREAMASAGITPENSWIRYCPPMVEEGREASLVLLAEVPELTALFCYNDLVAVGALQACAALGYDVPDRIAIIGFDDIALAALVDPPLTTCHVPRLEMGTRAFTLLLDQINGCTGGCTEVLLQPRLVIRSSAPLPDGSSRSTSLLQTTRPAYPTADSQRRLL